MCLSLEDPLMKQSSNKRGEGQIHDALWPACKIYHSPLFLAMRNLQSLMQDPSVLKDCARTPFSPQAFAWPLWVGVCFSLGSQLNTADRSANKTITACFLPAVLVRTGEPMCRTRRWLQSALKKYHHPQSSRKKVLNSMRQFDIWHFPQKCNSKHQKKWQSDDAQ